MDRSEPTGAGAKLWTNDTSCTVPAIPATGVAFRNFEYQGDAPAFRGVDRTREGYVEIIEMGVVHGALGSAAIHDANGVPANCGLLRQAWQSGGTWAVSPTNSVTAPSGGLYGYGVLINVGEGTERQLRRGRDRQLLRHRAAHQPGQHAPQPEQR
jgi:hypothetical protein